MDNLLAQGIELALFGMGTVFAFLAVLIFATWSMSTLILRFEPEVALDSEDAVAQNTLASDKRRLLALISAAITQHRK